MKLLIRQSFGLAEDAWSSNLRTADCLRIDALIGAAISARAMVSIVGPRGAGKSHAVRQAVRRRKVHQVAPLRLTRERLHMGDIESALVMSLSDERPRRSGEARSHQVRRILGQAVRQRQVLLLLDDAHVLHPSTLRSLKRLREIEWLGDSPLLTIVLVGQYDRIAQVPEVALRSDTYMMAGLTADEAHAAVRDAIGDRVDDAALAALAEQAGAGNWLDLIRLADNAIERAVAAGVERIGAAQVAGAADQETGPARESAAPALSDAMIDRAVAVAAA